MFKPIFDFFSAIWGVFKWMFTTVITSVINFERFGLWIWVTVIGAIFAAFHEAFAILQIAENMMNTVPSTIMGSGASASLPGGGFLEFANYVFPLNEFFAYFLAYIQIQIIMWGWKFLTSIRAFGFGI
jgi:hypothetical protein